MKNISFVIVLLLISITGFSQNTYYWVGGTAPISFSSTSGTKWNTSLDGSGTPRSSTVISPQDILIFDGNNVGGATPTTGTVTITDGSNDMGQLKFIHNANVIYQRNTSGTGTISIKGDATADGDFFIDSTSAFTLTSQDTTGGNVLQFEANSTGRIFGRLDISGSCRLSNLNFTTGGSIFFESGSASNVFVTKTPTSTNYPFGKDVTAKNGIVFKRGSLLNYLGGYSIFTNTSGFSPILFNEGSTLKISYNIPSFYVTSSNFFSSRRLANVIIAANKTVTAGSFYSLNDLTVEQGARLNLTSSYTPIAGNLVNNGTINTGAVGATMNKLLFNGNTPQSVSGTGVFDSLGAIIVGSGATVELNRNLNILDAGTTSKISGVLNTNNNNIYGTGKISIATSTTGPKINVTAGGYAGSDTLRLNASFYNTNTNTLNVGSGNLVIGDSIAPDTYIIATSSGNSRITLSKPPLGRVDSVTIISKVGTLATSNVYGVDSAIIVTGGKTFDAGTHYIFNGNTTTPFSSSMSTLGNLTINANVKTNKSITLNGTLSLQTGKLFIRSTDSVRISSNSNILGSPFDSTKYIVLERSGASIGKLRLDSLNMRVTLPIGTANYYLPATITTAQPTTITANVYEGITTNGTVSGNPFSVLDQRKVVNAVWQLNRISGAANANINLGWDPRIEGSFFNLLSNTEIGVTKYNGSSWDIPVSRGDNNADTASLTVNSFGVFSIGSKPQVNSLNFPNIQDRTYGDADFSLGVTSLNTSQPIQYSSNNLQVATVSSNGRIHIVGAGDAEITVFQATDSNYADTTASKAFHVNKKTLTVTADNKSKYERDPNPEFSVSYSGFVFGETDTVIIDTPSISTTADINSLDGTYPITATGASAANYYMVYVPGVLTVINKQEQTISPFSFSAKTYGDASFAANVTSDNINIPVVLTSSNTAVAIILPGNNIKIAGAGQTTITASQQGNNQYFPANNVQSTLTVDKASLHIQAIDTSKYQSLSNPFFTNKITGFVNGEDTSVFITKPLDSCNALLNSPIGNYTIYPYGAVATNYSITYSTGNLEVKPFEPFIFVLPQSKAYGDPDFNSLVNSVNSTKPILFASSNTSVATINTNGVIHIVGYGTTNISAHQDSDGVNPVADITRTLVVNKANLTIKGSDTFKYQGLVNPTLKAEYYGFVNNEDISVLTSIPTLSTNATSLSTPGNYTISVTGAAATNYNINYLTGTLSIIARIPQIISLDSINVKTYGNPDFITSVSSSNNTIPILLASSNSSVATITNENKIHIVGAGVCNITASQNGNDVYLPASNVTRALIVNKASLTIQTIDTSKYEGEANPIFNVKYLGFVNQDNPSVINNTIDFITESSDTSNSGIYAVTPTGANASNYDINYLPGYITVLQNQFTLYSLPIKTYGDTNFTARISSLNLNPVTFSSSDTAVARIDSNGVIHIVGAGTTLINARQDRDSIYPLGNKYRTLFVNKANLVAKAENKIKYQGYQNPELTVSYNGFVLGETESVLQYTPVPSTTAQLNSPIGNYPITLDSAAAKNYAIRLDSGILQILANQPQTIAFNPISNKTYGVADFSPGATSTNLTIPIIYTSSDTAVVKIVNNNIHVVGTGTTIITASQPGGPGYIAANDNSVYLYIDKAFLTIKTADTSKIQGANNPNFNFEYYGFVYGEDATALNSMPQYNTSVNNFTSPGRYPVYTSGASAKNYTINYLTGQITVYPPANQSQSLTYYVNSNKDLSVKIFSKDFNLGELKLFTISGQQISKKSIYVPAGFSYAEMPLNNIKSGVYLLVFSEKDRMISTLVSIVR